MIETRLTRAFGLRHPIVSAPMAGAGGGALAAAVSRAGGLGLIGGGYGDADWIAQEFAAAGNAAVGCGLITWRLLEAPEAERAALLDGVLARAPRALFLSFGDPGSVAPVAAAAGVPVICQVQTMADLRVALAAGAQVIVAQGSEAGGHGGGRGTMAFVPEVVDHVARVAPDVMVLAAGGIADGRGVAAALMLGADGVLMGTRFWASAEGLVAPGLVEAAIAADGDATVRTKTVDVARGYDWPARFDIRVMRSRFTARWGDDLEGLRADAAAREGWLAAMQRGDAQAGSAIAGEAIGLVHDRPGAGEIVDSVMAEAEALLAGQGRRQVMDNGQSAGRLEGEDPQTFGGKMIWRLRRCLTRS